MADEQAEPEPIRPRIVIEFAGPDSASATVHAERVHRGQRMIAVRMLEQWDQDMHQAELADVMQQAATAAQVRQQLARSRH